ncbi:MAG: hypothetical protein GXO02_06155 [Epsilonproteobacteria bacterium]|nr:hypothetical protein [Campylobacterota bacterium]
MGVAWATTFYFFLFGFLSIKANIFVKFLNGLAHSFIGLFMVLIMELIFTFFKKYEEHKKSNALLKEILKKKCD